MNLPEENEVEITLIGTGGGYGECIIVKLGVSSWIVIDSCIHPETKRPLALDYFNEIGVDYENDVIQIICTHWHNDHIQGISELLEACPKAEFCMPRINDVAKFLLFVEIDDKNNSKGGIKSTNEFGKCLAIVSHRESVCTRLDSNKVIYKRDDNGCLFEIYSLSPSEFVVGNFDKEISTLIKTVGEEQKSVVIDSPNEKSVAILIKFKDQRIILGADLEVGNHKLAGWLDILDNSKVLDEVKAQIFKIPHHGSHNGYDIRIFDKLIHENSILKLTPWTKGGNGLPKEDMLVVYKNHSEDLYITSNYLPTRPKPKNRDRDMEKIISGFNKTLDEIKFTKGIIRSRYNYIDDSGWKTETFHGAFKID